MSAEPEERNKTNLLRYDVWCLYCKHSYVPVLCFCPEKNKHVSNYVENQERMNRLAGSTRDLQRQG